MSSLFKKIPLSENKILEIHHDHDIGFNPREWDNLGTMICFHRRYTLGDKHNFSSPEEFREEITEKDNIILPLFLIDHSGISISTEPFSCPWDSGQVGYIYVSKKKIKKEFQEKRMLRKTIEKYLTQEVKTYDDYITGNCFGFVLKKEITCPSCNLTHDEHIDSCGGFLGDIDENGILDQIQDNISNDDMITVKTAL